MGATQVFSVLTEFKLDIAEAVVGSKRVQESLYGISSAADSALVAVENLGTQFVASLGLGGGLFEIVKNGVRVFNEFQNASLEFTTLIAANMDNLQGNIGSFNDRLAVSRRIMEDIHDTANRLNLSASDLVTITKVITPALIPQGLAGRDFSNAVHMGQSALQGSAGTGMSGADIAAQLATLITGSGTGGGALYQQLAARSPSVKAAGGIDALNAMDFKERFKVINTGLEELADQMKGVTDQTFTLTGAFDNVVNILRPIGAAIVPFVNQIKLQIFEVLNTQGKQVAATVGKFIKSFLTTPREMLLDLAQLKNLHGDVNKGLRMMGVVNLFEGLAMALGYFTKSALFSIPIVGAVVGSLELMQEAFRRMRDPIGEFLIRVGMWVSAGALVAAILARLGVLFQVIEFVATKVFAPLALFTLILQAMSRAVAMARIDDAQALLEVMPKLAEVFARVKMAISNILMPVTMAIDGLAQLMEPLFRWSMWIDLGMPLFEGLADVLDTVGTAIVALMAALNGLVAGVFQIIGNIREGNFSADGFGKAVEDGFSAFMDKHLQRLDSGGNVTNHVTNIGKVEIRNDFKENAEPDRVAFTLRDQLLKAAQNPTQSRNRSLQGAFARN